MKKHAAHNRWHQQLRVHLPEGGEYLDPNWLG
jgi:hypothetical protein